MKDLGKWQFISFLSRGMAMALGIFQSFIIIRILTVNEWGIVQLAVSIGGALGIYQHLGLASASTREISASKDKDEIFKVFVTSVFIRYFITLPIVLGLYFFAEKLALDIYHNPALIMPLKVYALTLLFQGVQSILNSVISGTKRFKQLFTLQVLVAVVSVLVYIPFVYVYRINGFFYALFVFNILNSFILGIIAFIPLKAHIKMPSFYDFKKLFKDIFTVSIGIYIVKILYTNWEKLGGNILGLYRDPQIVGLFAFAMLYSKKILSISDAVTDVSLPVLSEKYVHDIEGFKKLFVANFDKVFFFVLLCSTYACYWAPELINLVVGSEKYQPSYQLIPLVLSAFVLYSFIDILKSSVLIPAKLVKSMYLTFVFLLVTTIVSYFVLSYKYPQLWAMSLAMFLGTIVSFVLILAFTQKNLNLKVVNHSHVLLMLQAFIIGEFGVVSSLSPKILVFPVFLFFTLWGFDIAGLYTKQEMLTLAQLPVRKFLKRNSK